MYSFILKFQIILKENIFIFPRKKCNIYHWNMNYLAHAFLSKDFPEFLLGNLMGDFVKGKNFLKYPIAIQSGILLHRHIDFYTDAHPIVHHAQELLRPEFRISSGVFVDIFFDHFLATNPDYFDLPSLQSFTNFIYAHIQQHQSELSQDMKTFFGYMEKYNWLFHYASREGISKSIHGMCKRYPRLGQPDLVMNLFDLHYAQFKDLFALFFPELIQAVQIKTNELLLLTHGETNQ